MSRRQQLSELREYTLPRLRDELREVQRELFQNRIRYATRNLDNPQPLRAARKRIARLLTLIRQRELEAERAAEAAKQNA
ncbi:MAG: 50S ribosomal protein L29 [Armatimonadetes bacterium]|nr:50S ribosomal protein L29 [Armatimonadota bacterium]